MAAVTLVLESGEKLEAEFDARDRRAFERAGRRDLGHTGPLEDVIKQAPEGYVIWLAWHALKRSGIIAQPFGELDALVTDVTLDAATVEAAGLPDPTRPGP